MHQIYRYFYPTTSSSVNPKSVLVHPRAIQNPVVTYDCETE